MFDFPLKKWCLWTLWCKTKWILRNVYHYGILWMVNEANRNRNSVRDVKDFDRDECGLCFASKLPSAQGAYRADEEESFAAPVKADFNSEKRDEVSQQLNAFHTWLVSDQTHFDIIFCGGRRNKARQAMLVNRCNLFKKNTAQRDDLLFIFSEHVRLVSEWK